MRCIHPFASPLGFLTLLPTLSGQMYDACAALLNPQPRGNAFSGETIGEACVTSARAIR
jgi:hypothetical protein